MSEAVGGARMAAGYEQPAALAAPAANGIPDAGAAIHAGLDVPRDTTPTWEIEMLVSGAVLFGLFQLPPLFHGLVAEWRPHVGIAGLFATVAIDVLLTAAVYALIGCFVLHLTLRAYWVALVGVHSVFPGGPRWEQMRSYGPIQTRIAREAVRPLPHYITRTDNAASLVFATGFVLATSVLGSVAFLAIAGLVLWAATELLGVGALPWVAAVVFIPLFLAQAGAQVVDYKLGARLDPASRLARAVQRVLRAVVATMPTGVRSLAAVLVSNLDKRVVVGAVIVGFAGAMGTALATSYDRSGGLAGAGNYRFFDDRARGASVVAVQYESLRGDDVPSDRVPSLGTDVVDGPYLRLFIPYRPAVHNHALAAACPGVRPPDEDDGAAAARSAAEVVLQCAARVHRIALDGRPLEGLRLRFFADPRTNRRGFLAYVPTAALAPGEHLVTVWPVVRPGRPAPATPYELPFWK